MSAALTKQRTSKGRRRGPPKEHIQEGRTEMAQAETSLPEERLIVARFRLRSLRRAAWLQHLWSATGNPGGRETITHAEIAVILANQDSVQAEMEWAGEQEQCGIWQRELSEIEHALASLPDSRTSQLIRLFGLTPLEVRLLHLCAAVALDPALGRVCAYLQDHAGRPYVTEPLAARLLGMERAGGWTPEMNLFRWELVRAMDTGTGEPAALICDPQIKDWLAGEAGLDPVLTRAAVQVGPHGGPLAEWPVAEIAAWIDSSLREPRPVRLRVIVVAPRGGGKRKFAAIIAQKLGLAALEVNADTTNDELWPELFLHAQRQAFLGRMALIWGGESAVRRKWPARHPCFPVQFVLCEPGAEPQPISGGVDRRVALPMPGVATREILWRESSTEAARWREKEVSALAERYAVWPGDIHQAVSQGAKTPAEAAKRIREIARARFGRLAEILECPFTADDLVLPLGVQQLLDAIAFEAETRGSFWQQSEPRRLFPQGRGLIGLFSGPPGTGKTMAAQVIAARLGQDLCRVNVAQLVSKWVGETPKNCEEVIRLAAENNVVLFFDEADALFARRASEIRDAQDKFANTDTAFLLQSIESFPGVAILATNLKSNIDPAFMRRLRYVIEFPKPDAGLQRQLWTRLIGGLAGSVSAKMLAPAIEILSASIDATGAQIKFAVLGALFAARAENEALRPRHLLVGLDRELAKEGRSIGTREREKILKLEAEK